MTSIQPGWYTDPADPATQRYWDGEGWIGAPIPAGQTPPDGPPPLDAPPTPPTPPAPPAARPGAPAATPVTPPPTSPPGPSPTPPPGGWAPPPPGGYPPPPSGWAATQPPGGHATPPAGWAYPAYPIAPPAPRPHGHVLAGYGARLGARVIDILVVFALNAVVNAWFVWQYAREIAPTYRAATEAIVNGTPMSDLPQASGRAQYLQLTILLIATALWMAYEVPALGNTGQTLGKRLMRIRVVPVESDTPLGFGRAFRRWGRLGLWTPLWVCCIGFLFQLIDSVWLLFDKPLRQALHDKSARTVVVQVPPAAPPARPAADSTHHSTDRTGGSP